MSTLQYLTFASLLILSSASDLEPSLSHQSTTFSTDFKDEATCLDSGFFDCSKCSCDIAEDYYKISVIGMSLFSACWAILFILSYLFLKELRQKPGEIILVIAFITILLSVKSGIENYSLINDNSDFKEPEKESCQGLGFLHIALLNALNLYPFTFYIYQALTLQNPISASRITKKYYHGTTLSVAGILTAIEFGIKGIGRTIFGTCAFRTTSIAFLPIFINGSLFGCFVYLGYLIQKYALKRQNDLNRKELSFVQHYLIYLVLLCLAILGRCFVEYDIASRISKITTPSSVTKEKNSLNGLEISVFAFTYLGPFILTIARIMDPAILKSFTRGLGYICCCIRSREPYYERQSLDSGNSGNSGNVVTIMEEGSNTEQTKRLLTGDSLQGASTQDHTPSFKMSESLKKSIKSNQTQKVKDPQMFYSIFAGIHYLWYLQKTQRVNEPHLVTKDDAKYYKTEVKAKRKFSLHGNILKQNVPHIYREIRNKNYKIRMGIFTAYAPNLFQEFIEMDGVAAELRNSLALVSNFHNIVNTATTSQNTQFQFVTYNQKFILRSISKGDRRVLLQMLPTYLNHLKTKPFSLLARIYGVFRFEVMSPYRQVNWIIMKNVSERSGPCVERIYQLKGVGGNRETIMNEPDVNSLIFRGSELLKDGDFERYEQNIYIDPNMKKAYLDALKQDVEFLRSEKLLDYSLIVTIVNGSKPYSIQNRLSSSVILEVEESLEDKSMTMAYPFHGNEEDEKHAECENKKNKAFVSNVHIQNPFCHMKSTKANLFYNLEIDHFFTRYDWKRRWKTFLSSWKSEDSRLQPPNVYGGRFLQYMGKIGKDNDDFFVNLNSDEASVKESGNVDSKEDL